MNAAIVLPIETMTIAEKMDVIDRIMDDLSRHSASVPPIEWHGDLLKKRAESIERGDDKFMPLDEAAARIRKRTGR